MPKEDRKLVILLFLFIFLGCGCDEQTPEGKCDNPFIVGLIQ